MYVIVERICSRIQYAECMWLIELLLDQHLKTNATCVATLSIWIIWIDISTTLVLEQSLVSHLSLGLKFTKTGHAFLKICSFRISWPLPYLLN